MLSSRHVTTHTLYVDASGDDGLKFGSGSTLGYTVACCSVANEDQSYNEGIVLDVKRAVHSKPADEVKASTLLRHKNRSRALEELSRFRGQVLIYSVWKKTLAPDRVSPAVAHFLSIDMMSRTIEGGDPVPVVVDHCKRRDKFLIQLLANPERNTSCARVTFEDSRRYKMLQVADWFAGIFREFFERYLEMPDSQRLPCQACGSMQHLCGCDRRQVTVPAAESISTLSHLLLRNSRDGKVLDHGIVISPRTCVRQMLFFDCILSKK